jgi:hypothetical protein
MTQRGPCLFPSCRGQCGSIYPCGPLDPSVERERGIPVDGARAFKDGWSLRDNPFRSEHMRGKWRRAFVLAGG